MLLSPGMYNSAYFEHSYLAQRMGIELVEGARFWAKLTKTDQPGQPKLLGEPWHPRRIYNYYCVHLKMAPRPVAKQA